MKKDDVQVGATYLAVVSGNLVSVRINKEILSYKYKSRHTTRWIATNVKTGRSITIKSAAKLRRLVNPAPSRPMADKPASALISADDNAPLIQL